MSAAARQGKIARYYWNGAPILVPALRGPAADVDDSIPGKPRVATAPFALVDPNIRIPALNDVNSIAAKSRAAARAAALVLIQP